MDTRQWTRGSAPTLGAVCCALLAIGVALLTVSGAANAQVPEKSMEFTTHDPCGGGNADFCATVVVGRGVFDNSTLSKFRATINRLRAEYRLPAPATGVSAVIFDSPGGSLAAGIAMGRELRELKLDTRAVRDFDEYVRTKGDVILKPVLRGAKCMSACAYAFIGGSRRSVEDEGVLGVHQFRSDKSNADEGVAQTVTSALTLYVQAMGVSPSLVTLAGLTNVGGMAMLSRRQAKQMRVDNTSVEAAEWQITAAPDGTPILMVIQRIDDARTVNVLLRRMAGELLFMTSIQFEKEQVRADRLPLFPEGQNPNIFLTIDGQQFKGRPLRAWNRSEKDGAVIFHAAVAMPDSVLDALQRATSIELYDDDFGHALADLAPTAKLSNFGLSAGIAMVKRVR